MYSLRIGTNILSTSRTPNLIVLKIRMKFFRVTSAPNDKMLWVAIRDDTLNPAIGPGVSLKSIFVMLVFVDLLSM